MPCARALALVALSLPLHAAAPARAADWQPAERTETYAIAGDTGRALYDSIGEKGPEVAGHRTIANTRFHLLWTRRYRPQADGSCRLAVAIPHLTVTTTLPKAPGDLPPAVATSWAAFIAGIRAHERVHARAIVAMVGRIAEFSTGLTAPADPGCRKVRAKLQAYLGKTIAAHKTQSRTFDAEDWGEGGHMRALALALVGGP